MTPIPLAEYMALKHMLTDYDCRQALEKFFARKATEERARCADYLLGGQRNVETASQCAAFAAAYADAMVQLKAYFEEAQHA